MAVVASLLSRLGIGTVQNAVGYAAGTASGAALEPQIQPLRNRFWRDNPSLPISPDIAAQVAIKSPGRDGAMAEEAATSGINHERFGLLKEALDSPLSPGQMLELYRRKEISEEKLIAGLRSTLLEEAWLTEFPKLARVLFSPENLAMARQQGFVSDGEARQRSQLQGVDDADADLLYAMAGLPPGVETGLEMLRRGQIDEARFAQIVREGHTKTKYTADLLKLRTQPLSASVAAEALIRQRIPQERAIEIAEKNGYTREDFLLWSNMLGRPIATGQALQLARRGEFTFQQFEEAVARSDVRTEYADDLWKLRRVIPPLFQIARLVAAGDISDELAIRYVTEQGYDAELAHSIVAAGKKQKTKHTRDLSAEMIDELYGSGLESEQWAINALVNLGYDQEEAQQHLMILDARKLLSALQSHLSLVHNLYTTHKIDRGKAMANLDQLQIGFEARNLLLEIWDNEREAFTVRLTNAQIGAAYKKDIITHDDAIARWIANGYPPDDADVLAQLAKKSPAAPSPTAT